MNEEPRSRRRLLILLATAALVIPGTLAYIEFFLSRPVGEGPAGPAVDRSRFAQIWSDRQVQVIGVGDSITAGLGARSPRHTFFQRLLINPSDEYPALRGICLTAVLPNLVAQNFAISGSDSSTHLDVIRETIPIHITGSSPTSKTRTTADTMRFDESF